ncbi:MAG: glycosyltransferase [Saprospiraceae bacterium]|nr:glycosyltransferase [Saprospiraceae bacterium]
MQIIFSLLALLLILQLVYPFVTVLLAQVFGKERLNPHNSNSSNLTNPLHFACIITAYRNAAIAKPLVESLLRQTYPNHTIYLVADECPDFDFGIEDERFVLLRPDLPLRLKVKSIIHAVEHFKRPHDFIAVFDADNLAHPNFMEEINRYANAGFRCIQGQRTAKNLDTTYAALDSMGEHYKNYIEREVPYRLGGSAVISGSGMATEADLYKAYLASPEIKRGQHAGKKMLQEDKILQNFLLWRGEKIAYARNAIVFDEKVETGEAVETQRSRWLFSYFQNLPNSAGLLFRGLTRLNFNQFYFGWVTLALPMFIQVGLAGLLAILGVFIAPSWSLALVVALGIFALNILWVLKLDAAPKPVWDAVWNVPKFVWRQITSLLKMRDPNKHFKHTEHRKQVSVDELVKPTFSRPENEQQAD